MSRYAVIGIETTGFAPAHDHRIHTLARETFALAGVEEGVDSSTATRDRLGALYDVAFCFPDAEKEVYGDCHEAVVPRMSSGGLTVAENAIDHEATPRPMLERALSVGRVDAVIVPTAKGELVCWRR